jgi:capsular exopolysaccharide synthesis family protein
MPSPSSTQQQPGIDYVAILRGVWRRHKLLAVATFLGIALPLLAVAYYTTSPLYVSQAMIAVEPSALSQIPFLREPPRSDAIASHLILLKSRSLSEAVIEALPKDTMAELLAKPQHFGYYWLLAKNRLKGWFGKPPTVMSPHEQAVAELREARMEFFPSKEAPNVFVISATATNPRVAVDLVNTHIQVLLSRSRRVDNEEAKKSREFLEVQYQQVKDSVTRGEESIAKLQQQKGRLRPGGQTELELVRLAQLEGNLADTQANRQILASRIEGVRRALEQARTQEAKAVPERPAKTPQKDKDDDPTFASRAGEYQARMVAFKAAQDQLARLESKLASLRERYTEAHPQVQITLDEIARQQARVMQLAKELPAEPRPVRTLDAPLAPPPPPATPSERVELQNQLAVLDREAEALATKEESLKIQVARLRGNLRNLSQDEIEFGNLRRSVESNRNLMTVLSDRLMAARIREQGDSSVIRIVDPASFPLQTNASKVQRLFLMAIAFAGSIGFGLAFAVEFWRQPVETETDIERNTGLPILGSVGRMDATTLSKPKRDGKPILLPGYPAGSAPDQSRPIHVELYRAIRANIETERLKSSFRSILVTSPSPHEGKSTTILNLAHVFQEFGRQALLVEADLRRPALSSPLALTNKPGLVDYLNGSATLEQVCRRLPSGVTVIPGQVARGDSASLLASSRFKELLRDAGTRFDLILVDSAPILAVPDNLLLANIIDRVILVARATATSVRDLRKAQSVIGRAGGRILGVILNQANPLDVPYYHPRYRKYYTAVESGRPGQSPRRTPSSPRVETKRMTTVAPERTDMRGRDV